MQAKNDNNNSRNQGHPLGHFRRGRRNRSITLVVRTKKIHSDKLLIHWRAGEGMSCLSYTTVRWWDPTSNNSKRKMTTINVVHYIVQFIHYYFLKCGRKEELYVMNAMPKKNYSNKAKGWSTASVTMRKDGERFNRIRRTLEQVPIHRSLYVAFNTSSLIDQPWPKD